MSIYLNKEEKWRLKANIEEVSPFFLKAIIEKENKYFYKHSVVNPIFLLLGIGFQSSNEKAGLNCILLYR
ncbi:MAG: hypothetical protein CFE21_19645 [Bacteroidetes bacterium B1(2017)]|nr:MAG: hypothetical protein CFE21_19645 [Bacteroidetes bacterium B1(2017)]